MPHDVAALRRRVADARLDCERARGLIRAAHAANRAARTELHDAEEALARTAECVTCGAAIGASCREWGETPAHPERRAAVLL